MAGALLYLAERSGLPEQTERRERLAPGSLGRFERIVQRHHARLRRAVAGMLSEPDRVDDVLQEAYLKAYRRLPRRFANEAHEATWLYRVVFRCCLDELRRVQRRKEEPSAIVDCTPASFEDRPGLEVDRAFRRLSPEDRSVLVLVDLLGLGYDAAAKVLRVRRGTVASRLSVARRRFREALRTEGVRDA